ncbi:hypothetical protein BKA70DRAFT_1414440 [Coprinopsis sp. MPI-PUGE-AT-0042]|nr:hypothetical protein BKA70DRAFT_1414440 [Coprinopsis sp. MPI-PUGE-AT-0042]
MYPVYALSFNFACSNTTAEPVVPEEHTPPAASRLDVAKDYLNVTSSFLQLVLKKVPDAVDTNPVKVVFSLAKAVVELKEGMDDNLHAVEQRIVTISELLGTVEKALQETGTDSSEEKSAIEEFTTRVNMQLARLVQIKRQTRLRSFALQEDDKKTIVEIFDAVEDARNLLMVWLFATQLQDGRN